MSASDKDPVPESGGGSGRGREDGDGLGALFTKALAFAGGHLKRADRRFDEKNLNRTAVCFTVLAVKIPHRTPSESDGRRLPGDAKAGAVSWSEAGGG